MAHTENDTIFVVDANLDGRRRNHLAPAASNSDPNRAGEDAARIARGGILERSPSGESSANERTPLLQQEESSSQDDKTRASIYWLLPPFLLFTFAFGGVVVPKLNLVKDLLCRDYQSQRLALDPNFPYIPIEFGKENDQCRTPEVQRMATKFMLIGGAINGVLSALVSPKLGELSDRYGRTPLMALASSGSMVGEIITIIAASHPETFNVNWLFLGFAVDGICGSFIAGMAIAHAYAADCTTPDKRNVAFGYFHGCLFTGIALGPIAAGYIINATGSLLTMFWIAFGFHLGFILCLLVVIPESLPRRRRKEAREKHAIRQEEARLAKVNRTASQSSNHIFRILSPPNLAIFFDRINILKPLSVLWPTGEGSRPAVRRNLVLLAAIDTTMFGVAMGAITVVLLYLNYQFGWENLEQSVFVSTVNIVRVFTLFAVLPVITRLVRGPASSTSIAYRTGMDSLDLYLIRISVILDTLGFIGYTLVRRGELFILCGCITALGGIGSPTMQAALTKHVPPHQIGQLLGATGLLHALARVVSPIVFNGIYYATVGRFTQTVFLCLACAFGVVVVFTMFLKANVAIEDFDNPIPERLSEEVQGAVGVIHEE